MGTEAGKLYSYVCDSACQSSLETCSCCRRNRSSQQFTLNDDIVPYFTENWENLTSMPRRVKSTWHQTLQKTLIKETELFRHRLENGEYQFSLADTDLTLIGPNNDAVKQVGRKAIAGAGGAEKGDADAIEGPKTRGASKRSKANESTNQSGKRQKNTTDYTSMKLSGFAYPIDHPFNRDGYRYFLAEQDNHAPNRKEFEEQEETAGKPIPAYMYRMVRPIKVELSSHDRAPQLRLGDDRMTVTGFEGYSVVRATHGVSQGTFYFEVNFYSQPVNSHVRIGWSQSLAVLQASLGYDKFSYSWRSRKGTVFHDSIGKHYADGGYTQGDVLGCLIELPRYDRWASSTRYLPPSHKDLPLIKFKNHYYYEEKDEPPKAVKALKPLPQSRVSYLFTRVICMDLFLIEFFRNGVSFGPAFVDIYEGTYYPAASLYRNASLRFNFGPSFKYPPMKHYEPMCDRAEQLIVEQTLTDILFFVEKGGQLKLT